MAAVHDAAPAPHDPFVDLIPEQGVKLTPRHYAYLKIAEGCHNRCTFCIIPKLRGDLVSRPGGRGAARGGKAGQGGRQGTPRHFAGHQRLRPRSEIRHEPLARSRGRRALPRSHARTRLARRLGAAALRLPLSACRRGRGADERRQCAALYRRALPARLAEGAEGDAPPGQSGEDARAHQRVARDLPGAHDPLDLHRRLSRRDGGGFSSCCSTGWTKQSSTASAPSSTSRSRAPKRTISASSLCRTKSRLPATNA